MNAVNKLIVPLGVTITSLIIPTVTQAQFFNAFGRSGYYQESFLLSVEPTGVEDNHIAKVLTANNSGERLTREFVVNCNDAMPQILDEDSATVFWKRQKLLIGVKKPWNTFWTPRLKTGN